MPTGTSSKTSCAIMSFPLRVEFQVDPDDPDVIAGTVSSETENGVWTADLYADRAVYDGKTSIAYDVGSYTMVLLGDPTSTNTPGGHSYGTITVDRAGRLKFAGSLAGWDEGHAIVHRFQGRVLAVLCFALQWRRGSLQLDPAQRFGR